MIVDVNDLLGEDEIYLPINIMSLDEIENIFNDVLKNLSEKSFDKWYDKNKTKYYVFRKDKKGIKCIGCLVYKNSLKSKWTIYKEKLEKNITDLICKNLNEKYDKVYEIVIKGRLYNYEKIKRHYEVLQLYYLIKVRENFKRIINKLERRKERYNDCR
jgi:hypothetical protein